MITKARGTVFYYMTGVLWALATFCALWGMGRALGGPGGGGAQPRPVTMERKGGTTAVPTLEPTVAPTPEPEPTAEPAFEPRTARIRAAGDLMTHQRQLDMARREDGSYDFRPQYALIAETLSNADYTLANLETTLSGRDRGGYSGYPMFNTPDSLLETIRDAGVDFLTLANNHILDRGFEGLLSTVASVDRHGFGHGGAYRSQAERSAPTVVEVNGIRIGFLCYTESTNGMEKGVSGADLAYGVRYLKDADFDRDVRDLRRAGAEVIIAMPHWGVEYRREPDKAVAALAQRMIAAGVDVILGSHPHMVQPVEFIEVEADGGVRRGLVAYSLGNFISNQSKQYTYSGIVLEFTLREREAGGFDIDRVGFVPTFCWRQERLIQTIPSLKYYNAPPAGMEDADWEKLRASCEELRTLIDSAIPMLLE